MTCIAHAESLGRDEERQSYSALSRLTGLMTLRVQTTCHQTHPDGMHGVRLAKARSRRAWLSKGVVGVICRELACFHGGRRNVRSASSVRPVKNPKRRTLRTSNLLRRNLRMLNY